MQVKLRVAVADGLGHRYASGQIVSVDADQARNWVGVGIADPVKPVKRTAVKRAPRTTKKG